MENNDPLVRIRLSVTFYKIFHGIMDIMAIIYVYVSVHINHISVPIRMQDTGTISYNQYRHENMSNLEYETGFHLLINI